MYAEYTNEINEEEMLYEQHERTSDIQLPPIINTLLLVIWSIFFLIGLAVIYLAKNPLAGALIIAVPTFIGMVIKPTFALCMMMLALPTGAGIGYKQIFSLDRGVGIALAISFLLNLMVSRPPLHIRHKALWVFVIYTIWIFFASLGVPSPYVRLEMGRAFTQFQLLALVFIVYWILQTNGEKTFRWALRAYVIGTLGTIIIASISGTAMKTIEESTDARYAATLGEAINVNLLAFLLGFAFLAAIYLLVRDKNIIWRTVHLIAILLLPIMLFRTASRGIILALAFAILFPLLFIRQILRRPALAVLLLLLIVFVSGSVAIFAQKASPQGDLAERLTNVQRAKESINLRLDLITKAIKAAQKWPTGTGYYSWFERAEEVHWPHTDLFIILGVYGFPGAILFSLFVLLLFITIIHTPIGLEKLYTRAVLIFLLVSGLSHAFIFTKVIWVFMAFVMAGERIAVLYLEQSKSTAIDQNEQSPVPSPAY